MSERMHIGIIGCGKQAEKHAASLLKIPGISVSVADIIPENAQALARRLCVSVREPTTLVSDPAISAVVICTPTQTHAQFIEQAIAHHKAFFCEKPLCASLEELQALIALNSKASRQGLVGYIYRYAPIFTLARELLAEQASDSPLGKPTAALLRIGGRGSHQLWKHLRAEGGGAINEMLVHMLDLAYWLFGEMAGARLLTKELLRPHREIAGTLREVDAEDFVVVDLTSQTGVRILIEADLLTPGFHQTVEIMGENGNLFGSIQPELPSRLFCSRACGPYQAGWNTLTLPTVQLLDEQMAHFVDLVRHPGVKPRASIEDSLVLMKLMSQLQTAGIPI